jgi:hypothetical protein
MASKKILPFVGAVVMGGAAFFYAPDFNVEKVDAVKETEFINGKKMFLKKSELTQLNPDTNELIILGENYVQGRYEVIYFTNKKMYKEWAEENDKLFKTGK